MASVLDPGSWTSVAITVRVVPPEVLGVDLKKFLRKLPASVETGSASAAVEVVAATAAIHICRLLSRDSRLA